tara:strand:+ start:766 stop:942 length:177 start_codon:yes stop_codon:yes gene_type:complete
MIKKKIIIVYLQIIIIISIFVIIFFNWNKIAQMYSQPLGKNNVSQEDLSEINILPAPC